MNKEDEERFRKRQASMRGDFEGNEGDSRF